MTLFQLQRLYSVQRHEWQVRGAFMVFATMLYYCVSISRAWQTLSSNVNETEHGDVGV
jgi:hypothetical protein